MTYRVLNIRPIIGSIDYHVEVEQEHRHWFRQPTYSRQQYRGRHMWKLYPQGTDLYTLDPLHDWLDAYVQQYEWSRERA